MANITEKEMEIIKALEELLPPDINELEADASDPTAAATHEYATERSYTIDFKLGCSIYVTTVDASETMGAAMREAASFFGGAVEEFEFDHRGEKVDQEEFAEFFGLSEGCVITMT